VEVGTGVTRFKIGDRILGHAVGSDKDRNSAAEGGFQRYTVLLAHMTAPIPKAMAFEDAVVLPLGLSTAASALFQRDMLALQHPGLGKKMDGKMVLVWGGSTSVGSNAIQLAAAAGYEVVATGAPQNFDYLRKLGATKVFDYRSVTVINDIVEAIAGNDLAGALAIGAGAAKACVNIASQCRGKRFVVLATPQISMDRIAEKRGNLVRFLPAMIEFIAANVGVMLTARLLKVKAKFVFGTSLKENEVGTLIYEQFLPSALEEGRYLAAPGPLVVGQGLESIDSALALHRAGVSARKVVVTL
jgi:NADPH:quinone reductase-like Zn-dependent oxidoreductase